MPCFSCGQTFNGTAQDLLQRFKQQYLERGIDRYFYTLKTNGDIKIVKKDQFNVIFETQIKPNFINGAEYAHISEFR